jgi:hypothetical protein
MPLTGASYAVFSFATENEAGGGQMDGESVYRVFVLRADGHIVEARILDGCVSDDEAIERARQMLDGHDLEVWDRNRRLVVLLHTEDDEE